MCVEQCHKPPMTGNAVYYTKYGDDWGMVYDCYTHISYGELIHIYGSLFKYVYGAHVGSITLDMIL